MLRLLTLPIALLAVLAACDESAPSGRVELVFSLPDEANLSPINGLAEISVIARAPGAQPQIQTVRVDNGRSEITVGQISPDASVEISVELRSASQRLIGFGRSPGLIAIDEAATTEVAIELRRPFAYLTGERGVTAFDGTLDLNSPDYRVPIGGDTAATAVATNAGGDLILVASASEAGGGTLRAIATRDHLPVADIEVPLSRAPTSVAVSPDDVYVVVTHASSETETGGVSIAFLADVVSSETPSAAFVEVGNVDDIAIALGPTADAAPVAMLLLNAARDCAADAPGPASSVVGLDLSSPDQPLFTATTGSPIPDIAVDAPTQTLLLASPCTDEVLAGSPLSNADVFTALQTVRAVNSVATRDGQVVSVGTIPFEEIDDPESDDPEDTIRLGAALVLTQSRLDGSGSATLELQRAEERSIALNIFENRLPAVEHFAYDLALSPGGDLVALLSQARHVGEKVVLTDGGNRRPFVPLTTLVSYEYQLVDLAAGTQSQRLRTQCDLSVVLDDEPFFGYALPDWECSTSTDQDTLTADESFVPPHVTTLYGAR